MTGARTAGVGSAAGLEESLRLILRGAAKIVGCGTTNLILINEKTGEIRVRLGTSAIDPTVTAIETLLGGRFDGLVFPMTRAKNSLILRSFRDRCILETGSVAELVGSAFPAAIVPVLARLVGERRLLCVPALGPTRAYGVLIFERDGAAPFSRQQRELLLRYARRIGEILENDLVGQGQHLVRAHSAPATLANELLQLTLADPAPALFLDPELVVTSVNDAVEPLLGYAPAELLHREVGALFAEPHVMVEVLWREALDPGIPYRAESALVVRRDGSLTAARIESLILADEEHAVVGYVVLVRPNADAARPGADRLVRQERLATMGEMAAQLAHELRNPIVAIGATLDTLIRDPATPADHRTILGAVAREVVRMDLTLRDYLAARNELAIAEHRLDALVADARELLAAAHRLAGKSITVELAAELVVRADRNALRHVLFNLMLNALEASPAGGEVHVRAARGGRHLAIYVEDRGHGLTAPAGDCFQPFFTTKQNGTGLGLSVCQDIVQAHGGLVELRGREGGGCQAVVVLPLAPGGGAEAGA